MMSAENPAGRRSEMARMKSLITWTEVLLFGITLLAGCSNKEKESRKAPEPVPAPAPAPQPAPAPAPAPAPPAAPSGMPSTQGEHPGLTVAIQELKRSSD